MAEPARPRPRPRPRPVAKQSNNVSAIPSASSSSSAMGITLTAGDGTRRVIQIDDTDDMFIRNRRRTAQTWEKLDERNKEAPKADRGNSSDEDDRHSPSKPKHKRKKESHDIPLWERSREVSRMLSEALSDKSDDDDVQIVDGATTPTGKRKRRLRSRSRSITPPPELPDYQVERTRDVIRKALQEPIRAQSPTIIDLDQSADAVEYHSDLNAIAQEVADNAARGTSQAPADASEDHITVTVKWRPHPLDPNGKAAEWQYMLDRNDSFRELFEATAEDACIRSANLILTYQGKRFFPSVSPHTLHIWGDTAELEGYDKTTFEYIQQNPQTKDTGEPLHTAEATPPPETQDSAAESEPEDDTFKLVFRSEGNKDISLTVRPTTKCGAILKGFLKKLGIADQYPSVFADTAATPKKNGRKSKAAQAAEAKNPRLCIDGDKMNNETPIGDMDLEDGDMVEVVGL